MVALPGEESQLGLLLNHITSSYVVSMMKELEHMAKRISVFYEDSDNLFQSTFHEIF